MGQENSCACSSGPTLIFACSGAADVGEIADNAARQLARDGVGKMFCTVGLGGRIGGILKTTESAEKVLAIDGCPLNCVKHSLELAGFSDYQHLQLADLGMEKCCSPVTQDNIEKVVAAGKTLLAVSSRDVC